MRPLSSAYKEVSQIPPQIAQLTTSVTTALDDMKDIGITAFLRDTMYELLRTPTPGFRRGALPGPRATTTELRDCFFASTGAGDRGSRG